MAERGDKKHLYRAIAYGLLTVVGIVVAIIVTNYFFPPSRAGGCGSPGDWPGTQSVALGLGLVKAVA